MLEIVGHRILVKPDEVKEQFDIPDGLKGLAFEIAMDTDQERREKVGTQIGTVVGIGPTAWHAFDKNSPDWKPWCKLGDKVIFARYAGKIIEDPADKVRYMVLNDEDIQAVVKKD